MRTMYVSKAEQAFTHGDLQSMCFRFAAANARVEISGVLLRIGNYFVQVLEGEDALVAGLMRKIRRDHRHSSVTVLLTEEASSRVFAEWSMHVIDCDQTYYVDLEELAELREQIEDVCSATASKKEAFARLVVHMVEHVRRRSAITHAAAASG
ncbi:BLUF domain-containing protein [Botrimarina sp.]|uniref:BLUF domain-containing protein n=1 Tax=Botrimarina sp. TaxID=2795802 RepID=UPI0032EFB930